MICLYIFVYDQVDQEILELFVIIKCSIGKLLNVYVIIGSNLFVVFVYVFGIGVMFVKSLFSKCEQEVINFVVSEVIGCDYCVVVYIMIGKMVGYIVEQMCELCSGLFVEDVCIDVLVKFVLYLVQQCGMLDVVVVDGLKVVGFDDCQLVEILLVVSVILFINMVNCINDIMLDFFKVV